MKIIGIDQSSRKLAIVLLDHDGDWQRDDQWACTIIEAPKKMKHRADVLGFLHEGFNSFLMGWWNEHTLFIEKPLVGPSVKSTIVQAQVQGLVLGIAGSMSIDAYDVHPSIWKRDVVGAGNAKKPDVEEWLKLHHPVASELSGGDQDLVDAACIALYGAQVIGRARRAQRRILVDPG